VDRIAKGRKRRSRRRVALPCHSERSEESLVANACEGAPDREGAKEAKGAKGCAFHPASSPILEVGPSTSPKRFRLPSINLIADIAARGKRHLITGRWRGKGATRRRHPGALETLEHAGLLAIETRHAGPQTRYRFHVLREPPILAPHQLAQLPPRLQQLHADLLARCGMDQHTYQQRAHSLRRRAAQDTTPGALDTTPGVQDTTPSAQDTTNKYKEERLIEEVWRTIKDALKLQVSRGNYRTYLRDTHAIAFDRNTGALLVEASSPLAATQLNNYFAMTIRRAIANERPSIHGVPIDAVDFIPHPQQLWDPVEGDRASRPRRASPARHDLQ